MKKYFVVFLALLLSGCASDKEADLWEGKDVSLTHEVLYTDSLKIGMADPEAVFDSTMIVNHSRCVNAYSLWKLKGDSLSFQDEFISRGEGPHEMFIPKIYVDYGQERLVFFAPYNGENKAFCVEMNPPEQISDPAQWETYYWRNQKAFPRSLCPVDSTLYLAMNFGLGDNMFALFDMGQDTLVPIDYPYPSDGKDVNAYIKSTAYTGVLFRHPDKSRFVYSNTPWGRYVFVFDLEGDQVKNVVVLSDILPDYGVAQDGLNIGYNDQVPLCYNVQVGKKYIYMMYNDFTMEDLKTGRLIDGLPMSYYKHILVYDWEGRPVKRLNLDLPVWGGFCVDKDEKNIYAITDRIVEDNETVVRFRL